MIRLRHRRWLALCVTCAMVLLFSGIHWLISARLGHAAYWSGGSLFACLLLLILLGVRRRLVMLPLGSVATWVQIHIYTGLFALAMYVLHVPRVIGAGWFEVCLSMLFWLVSLSGLYGVYVSRTLPRRLNAVPGEYRFDRFAWHRERLAIRAAEVLEGLELTLASPVLVDFYRDQLDPYFSRRTTIGFVLFPVGTRRRQLLSRLRSLDRYLEHTARDAAGQLAGLVRKRDELDFHFALQMRLRIWVAFHAACSVLLLVWSLVHVGMVLLFL